MPLAMGKTVKLNLKIPAWFVCKVNLSLRAEMRHVSGIHQQPSKGSNSQTQCGLFGHILSNTKIKFHFRLISATVLHLDKPGTVSSVQTDYLPLGPLFCLCSVSPDAKLLFPCDVDCVVLHHKEMMAASAEMRLSFHLQCPRSNCS